MIGTLRGTVWLEVACVALGAASMPAAAQQLGRSVAWSPTRDAAPVAAPAHLEVAPIGSGVTRAQAMADDIASGRRPAASPFRQARLSPRDIGHMHANYVEGPTVVEHLPTPRGVVPDARMMLEHPGEVYGPEFAAPGCDSRGGAGCEACVDCCGNWNSCGPISPCALLPCLPTQNLQIFGGMEGFTGPLNRGTSGSFGFYEGFNHAVPLCRTGFCGQFGAAWTQSNFDGSVLTTEERQQVFLTAGIFRRVDWGLQGGLVFDYLHDEWDYELDIGQLRGEIGWRTDPCNEFGFWFTTGVSDSSTSLRQIVDIGDGLTRIVSRQTTVEANDLYAFYFRRHLQCGGDARLFAGFSGNNQGLFGGDATVPLNPCLSLQASATYVTSSNEGVYENRGYLDETWNVAVGLVWTPFARPGNCCPNYCRPLFNVANNGSFATRITTAVVEAN
ncbi:MAG: DUF6666 family protein [Pirellulaceae bacterium]|nr:DUF6666 family protein [Pirellulaceae bacterium]